MLRPLSWHIALVAFICASLWCVSTFSAFPQTNFIGGGFWGDAKVSGGAATTFDPVNIDAGLTLSNGNLTVTSGMGASVYAGARSTTSHSTGKFCAKFTLSTNLSGNAQIIGVNNSGVNGPTGFDANLSGAHYNADTNFYINSASVLSTLSSFSSNGDAALICADTGGGKLYWEKINAGNWNNNASADPASGSLGISISPITGPYYVGVTQKANFVGVITANFTPTGMPSGYSGW